MDGRRIRRTIMLECWMEETAASVAYVPGGIRICINIRSVKRRGSQRGRVVRIAEGTIEVKQGETILQNKC